MKACEIRRPILAGTWYPGDPLRLKLMIGAYLGKAQKALIQGDLKALIVPHAGYSYSGQVAAFAYALLKERQFERVILLGPSHRVAFTGASVNLQAGYETPLGVVPVDLKMGEILVEKNPMLRWSPPAHAHEHSLEIQLPFLQTVLRGFQIIPILMGEWDYGACNDLAATIAGIVGKRQRTLLIASSDLSHFHSYERAIELDNEFMTHIRALDPEGLHGALLRGTCEACGGGPVVTVLLAAKYLGADKDNILSYANSGDVTNERNRVVGYLSAALHKSETQKAH